MCFVFGGKVQVVATRQFSEGEFLYLYMESRIKSNVLGFLE